MRECGLIVVFFVAHRLVVTDAKHKSSLVH
jgi:hypothetical protein